jgi:hypothetical protein
MVCVKGKLAVVGISDVLELEYSCEICGLLWRVRVDANEKGNTMALTFRSPRLQTRYSETKHKWNLGMKTLSMETHVVKTSTFGT